jgi:hypothetical protein
MCSRFSLAEDNDFLAARLGVSAMALANYRPRYNIARALYSVRPALPAGRHDAPIVITNRLSLLGLVVVRDDTLAHYQSPARRRSC